MNFREMTLLVCGGTSFVAHASQMQLGVPPALEGKYLRLMQRLSAATALDDAFRNETTDLISRLNNYEGGELKAGLLTQALARLTAPQQQQEKQEKEKKEREDKACQTEIALAASAVLQYIPIHAGRITGAKQESLDTNEPDPISYISYAELIEQQREHGDPFMLARVITLDNQGNEYPPEYYEAHGFNQWRFGQYPLSNRQLQIVQPTSPKNRQIVQNSVQYFMYDPQNPMHGFTWMFTEEDLMRGNSRMFYSYWLEANQNFDPAMKAQAQVVLGEMYSLGRGVTKDDERALFYLSEAVKSDANPWAKAQAQARLGEMYSIGQGVTKDDERALFYFSEAVKSDANPWARALAQAWLGEMYYLGRGATRDDERALFYFSEAVKSVANPLTRAHAQLRLGEMYSIGQGVTKDDERALFYLSEAVKSDANPWVRARAQIKLATMYLGRGVTKDDERALFYLSEAVNQTANPWAKAQAQIKLATMYYLGRGVTKDYARIREYLQAAANQTYSLFSQKKAQEFLQRLDEEEAKQKTAQQEMVDEKAKQDTAAQEQPTDELQQRGEKHSISGGEPAAKRPRKDNNGNNDNGGGVV
jgi:TPR repeat protein